MKHLKCLWKFPLTCLLFPVWFVFMILCMLSGLFIGLAHVAGCIDEGGELYLGIMDWVSYDLTGMWRDV